MGLTGKKHLDWVIRHSYGGDEKALAREFWIQTHPALIEAQERASRAAGAKDLISSILHEMWEEVHEDDAHLMPDEGNVLHKVEVRDRGRDARRVAAEQQDKDDECELRATLKAAILKYGVKIPDKVNKVNKDTSGEDALDETFGHLHDARDELLWQLHEKYGCKTDGDSDFAVAPVMDDGKPRLEVIVFVPLGDIEVPPVFLEFPVTVVEGKKSATKGDVRPVIFPDEGSTG